MNISEMHVYFRQYAQQMGMQNVRNILPSQIDVLLNTAISDKVNKIVKENVSVTGDRITSDNSKISHINALKPLYQVDTHDLTDTNNNSYNESEGIISFEYDYEDVDCLFIIGYSIRYTNTNIGNGETTRYFPVRLIDDSKLADTLNDFVLRNRATSPIITLYNYDNHDLYIERLKLEDGKYVVRGGLQPKDLRIEYIEKPNVVYFDTEYNPDDPQSEDNSVDCNLPEFLHVDIVKAAVDLYRNAINGGSSTYVPQENAQPQNEQSY